jgi:electron transport complex protein RnfC
LSALVDVLTRTGLRVARWPSPDLLGQLHQALRRPVDTLVCCAMDSDPPLRLNAIVAHHRAVGLARGLAALSRATGAGRALVVVEAGAPGAWTAPVEKAVEKETATIVQIPHRYPQTDPTLLLWSLTGRTLRPGRLPTEQGAIVVDAPAAAAVGHIAENGTAPWRVPVAVSDHRRHKSGFFLIPTGARLIEVLHAAGAPTEQAVVLAGDRLRQNAIPLDAALGQRELTLHVMAPSEAVVPDPCIRCTWCAEHCPVSIHPAELLEAAQESDPDLARWHALGSCIGCGVCSAVCPSRLPLWPAIRGLKEGMEHG